MKRIVISLVIIAITANGMERPPVKNIAMQPSEKSHLERLPGDLKKVILAHITAKNLDEAAKNIKALATTNKFFHDYINREDILKYIITTMATQIPDVTELDAAEKLQTMLGMKNPTLQAWLEKRKIEIPKERALIKAVEEHDSDAVANLLQEHVAVNAKGRKNKLTALTIASMNNYKEIVQQLVDAGADINAQSGIPEETLQHVSSYNPLYIAADRNAKESVAILLAAGANPNIPSTTFHITPLITAAQHNNGDIVKALLAAKADVNKQDAWGYTPLMKAAYNGYKEIITMLLNAGAKRNIQDNDGNTALIWAAYNDLKGTAEMLLKAGADPQLKSKSNGTALELARKKNYTALEKLLLEYGAQDSQKEQQ
jgi:ankyrin repeat protein